MWVLLQPLIGNPHTDWPLSGPNESPILIQEREVSFVHTMCAQASKPPLWPSAPQAVVYPDRNTLTWTTGNHAPVSILKCFSGSFWSLTCGHWPIEQHQSAHLSLWEHWQGTWGPETTSLSWERKYISFGGHRHTNQRGAAETRPKPQSSKHFGWLLKWGFMSHPTRPSPYHSGLFSEPEQTQLDLKLCIS